MEIESNKERKVGFNQPKRYFIELMSLLVEAENADDAMKKAMEMINSGSVEIGQIQEWDN